MLSFILCRTLASWPDWDFFVGELAHVAPNERMYNFCQTSEHSFSQFIEESCSVASKGLAATFLSASLGTHDKNNQVPERKFSIMRPNDSQKPTLLHLIPLIRHDLQYHIVMLPTQRLKTRNHSRSSHSETKWFSRDPKTTSAHSHTWRKWGQVSNLLQSCIK